MAYEWRCADCDASWPEPGRGQYVLAAGKHGKQEGHKPLGLVDTETGEIVVAGSYNRILAETLGIIEKPDRTPKKKKNTPPQDADTVSLDDGSGGDRGSSRPMSQPQPIGGSDPAMTGEIKKTRQSVESLGPGDPTGRVVGFEVQWPLWALSFFDILRGEFLDENDQPYTWTTKDFVRFVLDVYKHQCHNLVQQVIASRYDQVSAAERVKIAKAMIGTVESMPTSQFLARMADEVESNDKEWAELLRMQAQREGA